MSASSKVRSQNDSIRLTRLVLTTMLLVGAAGCGLQVGPKTLESGRFDYNRSIAQSWNEQLLLNLVRLRYRDTPYFLEVSNVLSQFETTSSAGASIPFNMFSDGSASAGYEWIERPTISYAPLQGEDFVRRLLTPIQPSTLVLLGRGGWSLQRLMVCCVERLENLDNAHGASGPTPAVGPEFHDFQRASHLMRELQRHDLLTIDVLAESGSEEVRFRFQDDASAEQAAQIAELKQLLRLNREGELGPQAQPASPVAMRPRSVLGVLFFLSHAVQPPAAHEEAGWVTTSKNENGDPYDWLAATGGLLHVESARTAPADAFAVVRYHDHDFFIRNSDLESKSTFALLLYLFSLQASDVPASSTVLTVSAGG